MYQDKKGKKENASMAEKKKPASFRMTGLYS
jgi:hypothetical protein